MKKIVRQWCFNFQGCEFKLQPRYHLVKKLFILEVNQFFVKIDALSLPCQFFLTFYEILLHSCCYCFKANPPLEQQKQIQNKT